MRIFIASVVIAALGCFASPAKAQSCDDCTQMLGGNLDVLQMLDFNGNGFSTFDLIILRRYQLATGLNTINLNGPNSLISLFLSQTDVTFDNTWDTTNTNPARNDFTVLQRFFFFLNATGQQSINVTDLITCGRMYILGIC